VASLLELREVSKRYGPVTALDGVSIELNGGEVLALVGDNGAGKSTLVKIMSGVLRPDGGELLLDGRPRRWANPREALAAGIETVYQDAGLAPHLSISANVFLGREPRRRGVLGRLGFVDGRAMRGRAHAELDRVGIRVPGGDQPVRRLSGGQRQAVAIGRAIAWARKIVLLDEPTNHLGIQEQGEVIELVQQLRRRGVGVVLISHTLPHVLELADRIVTLRLGRVVSIRDRGATEIDDLVRDMTGVTSMHDHRHIEPPQGEDQQQETECD
jgi:simple sugar transport system ATP-binding protein